MALILGPFVEISVGSNSSTGSVAHQLKNPPYQCVPHDDSVLDCFLHHDRLVLIYANGSYSLHSNHCLQIHADLVL